MKKKMVFFRYVYGVFQLLFNNTVFENTVVNLEFITVCLGEIIQNYKILIITSQTLKN